MIIYKYRKWCTNCQEWQLSDENNKDVCGTCGQAYGDYKLRDIPQSKKAEQRERFKRQRHEEFKQVLNIFSFVNPLAGDVRIGVKVIESDAGLRAIEKAERDEFERLKQWNRAERRMVAGKSLVAYVLRKISEIKKPESVIGKVFDTGTKKYGKVVAVKSVGCDGCVFKGSGCNKPKDIPTCYVTKEWWVYQKKSE